jgi:hypothetical protein
MNVSNGSAVGTPDFIHEVVSSNSGYSNRVTESSKQIPTRPLPFTIILFLWKFWSRVVEWRFNSHLFFYGATAHRWQGSSDCQGFTITLRHTTLGWTPLDEWSIRRRDLYLTTHNTHNRQTSVSPAGFEFTIIASERPQFHDGIGPISYIVFQI